MIGILNLQLNKLKKKNNSEIAENIKRKLNVSYKVEKLQNIENRPINNKAKLLKLEMEKDELKNIYFIYVNRLNLLNPDYFNDKGICILDSRIILNPNFPHLTLEAYNN